MRTADAKITNPANAVGSSVSHDGGSKSYGHSVKWSEACPTCLIMLLV